MCRDEASDEAVLAPLNAKYGTEAVPHFLSPAVPLM